jgi:hypothetical protein
MGDTFDNPHLNEEEVLYDNDIFENWVDVLLGINYLDACEIKDSTELTGSECKEIVRKYRKNGGLGNPVLHVLEEYERGTKVDDPLFYPKKESAYLVGDFI